MNWRIDTVWGRVPSRRESPNWWRTIVPRWASWGSPLVQDMLGI